MGRERHTIEEQIKTTLDILWALKSGDKHYFMAYGEDSLKSLVKSCSTKTIEEKPEIIDSDNFVCLAHRDDSKPKCEGQCMGCRGLIELEVREMKDTFIKGVCACGYVSEDYDDFERHENSCAIKTIES